MTDKNIVRAHAIGDQIKEELVERLLMLEPDEQAAIETEFQMAVEVLEEQGWDEAVKWLRYGFATLCVAAGERMESLAEVLEENLDDDDEAPSDV